MGRLKKYQTTEEQKLAQKLASKKYYWNNKEQEDAKSRERYQRKRTNKEMY